MIDLFAHRSPLTVEGGVQTFDVITGTTGNDTLDGTSGADSISGLDGDDVIDGHEGDDFIDGGPGADLIHGGTGADTILGGDGNDLIYTSETGNDLLGDSVDGGAGNDQFIIGSSYSVVDCGTGIDLLGFTGDFDTLHGGGDRDMIINVGLGATAASGLLVFGDDGDDTLQISLSSAKGSVGSSIYGGDGDDELNIFDGASGHVGSLLSGGSGDDLIKARSSGDDTIDGGSGGDTLSYVGRHYAITCDLAAGTASGKGIGHDSLIRIEAVTGGISDDVITGDDQRNQLSGKNGSDLLTGADGDDELRGGGLADTLIGGLGRDQLTGGGGHDLFVFNSLAESTNEDFDFIVDLKKHDVIDLSAIDADVNTAGDQAFTKAAAFDGHAGQLTLTFDSRNTLLEVDVNGDAQADMTIVIAGKVTGHDAFVL